LTMRVDADGLAGVLSDVRGG